ncbi:hypothetical protein [Amycolatopsis anabasis]|uniref:hypothetical protein n=1 Tax=Amycolatopsis anabasis TaxID=1840409 RepID=UPI00131B9D0E|nr:hypothetical protein [Amycolatopsis anabasis]
MSTEAESETETPNPTGTAGAPPTMPCTVVWSRGRPYVLEGGSGRPRWMGTDTRGRPEALTRADLQRRGWSYRRAS